MKISLALGPRRPLDRTTAWGCLTANLAVPGCGSLVSGRVSGYFQMALAIIGVALTTVFGLKFIVWHANNWADLQLTQPDMAENFQELWRHLRPACVGLVVFLAGMLWALASSISILIESKKAQSAGPPLLDGEKS